MIVENYFVHAALVVVKAFAQSMHEIDPLPDPFTMKVCEVAGYLPPCVYYLLPRHAPCNLQPMITVFGEKFETRVFQ